MLTEEEAKTKWCPFVRATYHVPAQHPHPADHGYIGNRDVHDRGGVGGVPNTNCVASRCMAWRFRSVLNAEENVDRRGYCGLAGVTSP